MTQATIIKKINELEKSLASLKVLFFMQSKKLQNKPSTYNDEELLNTLSETRDSLWKKKCAKKTGRLS